jgi:hypothetical protein
MSPGWLYWVEDFVEAPELPPQIVGHTSRAGPAQKGRSWCLDGNQTGYGMLGDDGLEVRFLDDVSERR